MKSQKQILEDIARSQRVYSGRGGIVDMILAPFKIILGIIIMFIILYCIPAFIMMWLYHNGVVN